MGKGIEGGQEKIVEYIRSKSTKLGIHTSLTIWKETKKNQETPNNSQGGGEVGVTVEVDMKNTEKKLEQF